MEPLPLIRQAELEREAAAALFKGMLRQPGNVRALAEDIGYTKEYFALLRAVDRPGHARSETRQFSEHFLRRLAQLPWPPEVREELVYHIARSISLRAQATRMIRGLGPAETDRVVWEIRRAHDDAQNSAALPEVKRLQGLVRDGGSLVLARLSPRWQIMQYLEVLFCLNDVFSAFGKHTRALYFALEAREILDAIDERQLPESDRERLLYMQVNVLRAEGIPRMNLQAPRDAYACFAAADEVVDQLGRGWAWRQHLASDKMGVLKDMPRFSITEAQMLADQGVDAAPEALKERRRIEMAFRLADCYGQYGHISRGLSLLGNLPRPGSLQGHFGARFLARFYRTQARLAVLAGDDDLWRAALAEGLALTHEAGLTRDYTLLLHEHKDLLGAADPDRLSWEGHLTYTQIQDRLTSAVARLRRNAPAT